MTKEITKARILQEIQDKFKLREFTPEPFLFEETVAPIYDISPHLGVTTAKYLERSVTSTGLLAFFEVPGTQKWSLNGYNVVFMGAGAYTVAGVMLSREKELALSSNVYLDLTAAQTVSYAINLPKSIRLDPGDRVGVSIDGYTSTQDLRLYIDYIVETIR